MEMVMIIPSYNNEVFVERNLASLQSQSYKNFHVLYVDDASLDRTREKVETFARGLSLRIIQNKENKGAMENIYSIVSKLSPETIVLCLDGDDWLAHDRVLERIALEYQDQETWLTYGSYIKYPGFERGPDLKGGGIGDARKEPYCYTHLKTFYAGLFQQIRKEDLMQCGKFFSTCHDLAMMLPMAEMASDRAKYIEEVLYVYNFENPLGDGYIHKKEMRETDQYIRSLPPYKRLGACRESRFTWRN